MTKKTSPEVLAFLEELLNQAKKHQVTEVFVWLRTADGSSDYQFLADDLDNMLYELRTAIFRERWTEPSPSPMSTH